jgi:hypothetical protein
MTSNVQSLTKLSAKAVVKLAAENDMEIDLDGMVDPLKTKVHVALGIDSTASMTSVLASAKATATAIVKKLNDANMEVQMDIAAVNDFAVLVKGDHPITWGIDISTVTAQGGGDTPEAYSTFIKEACEKLSMIPDTLRFIIMVGDAYAHGMPPIQEMLNERDSFPDGDPNGITISLSMQMMQAADVTFIYVHAGSESQASSLWGAANAKYTDGVVIPMEMDDMDKVPKIVSTYIASQTSMAAAVIKKREEMAGKDIDEITKILSAYMIEHEEKVAEISERIEHTDADDFIKAVGTGSFRSSFMDFIKDKPESKILRVSSDGTVRETPTVGVGHFVRGVTWSGRESSTVLEEDASLTLSAVRRAASIATRSQRF